MPTLPLRIRILAGLAGCVLLSACPIFPKYECDVSRCPTSEYEVYFQDTLWRRMDTLGTAGLHVTFEMDLETADAAASATASASAQAECQGCTRDLVRDSAVLTVDRPIVSPVGDTVPAGVDLLSQPWKDKVGHGDVSFRFHRDVRFGSGRHTFAMTVPWEYEGTRVVLSDTSYLYVP